MDKTRLHVLGRRLRREFRVPDDLPFPMQKALEALATRDTPEAEIDNSASTKPHETRATDARNKDRAP